LAYEAFFYAVFGVALFARKNAAALVVAVIMFCVLSGLIAKPTSFSAQFYTAPILLEFAFGMGLAHLTLKRAGGPLVAAGSIGLMVGAAILSAHIAQSHHTRWHWRNLEGDLFWSARHIDRCWGDFTGKFRGSLPKSVYPKQEGRQLCALPDTFAPDPSRGKVAGSGGALLIAAPPLLAIAAHLTHRYWERPVLTILKPSRFNLRTYRFSG
jgi:peptidoglycan/LPS O-acetylase OafA/YrhL